MSEDRVIESLQRLEELNHADGDVEARHSAADDILETLVRFYVPRGSEIADAWQRVPKWYA